MEIRDQAYKDFRKGMKYKDIAEKYGVSLSAVKSWATRHWKNNKVATGKNKKLQPDNKKSQPKKRGAPMGNTNAKGNPGGGAPLGSHNALKHGGYFAIYWDTLDEEEKKMIEEMPKDEEMLLIEQIQLCAVRERRLMLAINKYKDAKGGLAISSIVSSYTKRDFENVQDKTHYEELRQDKINEGKISYLGHDKFTQTATEASINIVQRLERELTSVQSKKTKCIEALYQLRQQRQDANNSEVVDDWVAAMMEDEDG